MAQANPIPLTAAANTHLNTARHSALAFLDTTPPWDWVDALLEAEQAVENVHASHPALFANRLQIQRRPLCYLNPQRRTTALNQAGLSPTQRDREVENSALLSNWDFDWRSSAGVLGLVCSPSGTVTFQQSPPALNAFLQDAQQRGFQQNTPLYQNLLRAYCTAWYQAGGYWRDWHAVTVYSCNRRVSSTPGRLGRSLLTSPLSSSSSTPISTRPETHLLQANSAESPVSPALLGAGT